jgi:hypothetical protein
MSFDRLREVAEQATPGPWQHQPPSQDGTIHHIRKVNDHGLPFFVARTEDTGYSERSSFRQRAADAEHIATFDPPMALALLDVAEAAHRAMHGPARDTRPTDDLADALDRLREVTA